MASRHLVQHIQYVPFGEVFLEQRNSNSKWSTPYKFNGKELDDELRSNRRIQNKNKLDLRQTGLAYYHARYYDPRTSVWLSVDPLAEKKPFISSYVYCRNNPVNMIDPDGRDEYDFNNNGKLLRVIPNSEKDIVNVVDNKGNRIDGKSIELEYGTISSYETKNKGGKYEYDKYQIKGNDNGKKVFEFLADNTKVEWGLINFFSNKSTLTTSRDTGKEWGLYFELIAGFQMIGDVKSVTHNHPRLTPYPSGLDDDKIGDINIAGKYEAKYGNHIQSYIYLPNKNRFVEENYIPYSSKSDFLDFRNHPYNKNVLFEFTITTKRK